MTVCQEVNEDNKKKERKFRPNLKTLYLLRTLIFLTLEIFGKGLKTNPLPYKKSQ